MDWRSVEDAALCGDAAEAVRAAAELSHMLADWPADHVKRERTAEGLAAWLWLTDGERLACLAVAPWGSVHGADYVHRREFFAAPFPSDWRTKRKEGLAQAVKPEWSAFEVGGFACGMLADRRAVLCKVAELDSAGRLAAVRTLEGGPAVPVAEHAAVRWFGLTKWPRGLARLWADGRTVAANYPFLAILAGRAEREAAGQPVRRGKASKRGEQDTVPS